MGDAGGDQVVDLGREKRRFRRHLESPDQTSHPSCMDQKLEAAYPSRLNARGPRRIKKMPARMRRWADSHARLDLVLRPIDLAASRRGLRVDRRIDVLNRRVLRAREVDQDVEVCSEAVCFKPADKLREEDTSRRERSAPVDAESNSPAGDRRASRAGRFASRARHSGGLRVSTMSKQRSTTRFPAVTFMNEIDQLFAWQNARRRLYLP